MAHQIVERAIARDADCLINAAGQIRIVKANLETQRLGAKGGCCPDSAQTHNAENQFAQSPQMWRDLTPRGFEAPAIVLNETTEPLRP